MRGLATVAALALVTLAACSSGDDDGETPVVPSSSLRPLDARLVDLGRQVYTANCASCHGASGEGAAD